MLSCGFPSNAPRTAYRKGCRCERCRSSDNEYRANYRISNPDWYKQATKRHNQKRRGTVADRYVRARSDCKRLLREWSLSLEEYATRIVEPCFYCGTTDFGRETGRGLDRIDNSKGYTFANTVRSCWPCNNLRGDKISSEEMRVAMAAIMKYRREKASA